MSPMHTGSAGKGFAEFREKVRELETKPADRSAPYAVRHRPGGRFHFPRQ